MQLHELLDQIESYQVATNEIMSSNPGLAQCRWEIRDIPIPIMREYSTTFSVTPFACGLGIAIHAGSAADKCLIVLFSVEAKVKTTISYE